MSKQLRIAPGLALPIDFVGESTAILAKKGAGKTNTAKVLVEEVLDVGGVQVIALDPVGVWWALRAGADGKPGGGYPIAVFGGMHGDLPLEPLAGRLLAETAVESGQSMVLDVSGLETNGAMQRFAYEFAERLYTLKQASPTPLLLVLEEADEFAPQNAQGANVARMVGAFSRIVKRGRGRGLGVLVVTQRSAALNKNVLDQSDTLIVGRTVGPRDRAAVEGWVKHQDAQGVDDVIPSLPGLKTGEAWVWTPERQLLERVHVRKATTFDSSESPAKRSGGAVEAQVKPIDVDALGEKIRATVEKAKENDPAELRKKVRELEQQLTQRPSEPTIETVVERVEVPVPVFNGEVDRLAEAVTELRKVAATIAPAAEGISQAVAAAHQLVAAPKDIPPARPRAESIPRTEAVPRTPERPPPSRPTPPAAAPPVDGEFTPSRPQQKLLDALAWFETVGLFQPKRSVLAPMADTTSKSSGFEKNLSTLRTAGLIEYGAESTVYLTDAGRDKAAVPNAPATAEELQEAVFAKVSRPQAELLRQLIQVYPDALERDELAARAGTTPTSSGFEKNLSTLRSFGVIDYGTGRTVFALPILFLVED